MPRLQEYVLYTSEAHGVDAEAAILDRSMVMREQKQQQQFIQLSNELGLCYP